jgi:hypothetical protein
MAARLIAIEKLMVKISITRNSTKYSDVVNFRGCTGTAVVNLISTAGRITVSQQCSVDYDPNYPDAATWYDPVDSGGTAKGAVGTAVTVTTGKYITYDPVLTPWIRYKVIETDVATTVVTLTLAFQEEGLSCR